MNKYDIMTTYRGENPQASFFSLKLDALMKKEDNIPTPSDFVIGEIDEDFENYVKTVTCGYLENNKNN